MEELRAAGTYLNMVRTKFFEMAKNVSGDIVECGIGRGRSMIILCALNYFFDKNHHLAFIN